MATPPPSSSASSSSSSHTAVPPPAAGPFRRGPLKVPYSLIPSIFRTPRSHPHPQPQQPQPQPASSSPHLSHPDAVDVQPAVVVENKMAIFDGFEDVDITDYIEKQKRYEAIYARRLKAKYFSKKNFSGGEVFENETTIGTEIIKSSRWPCTRSFANPIHNQGDQSRSPSIAPETSGTPLKKYKRSGT